MRFHLGAHTGSFILLIVSVVFLILASISSPVVKSFKLGSTDEYDYGVFGYCKGGLCSDSTYPYKLSEIDDNVDWKFAGSARDTLSKLFILCPIAAGVSFLCLLLVGLCHFFSSGAIIFTILFNVVTFAVCTIACIAAILAFYPFVAWTGWILIGAAACALVSTLLLIVALFTNSHGDDEEDDSEMDDLTRFEDDMKFPSKLEPVNVSNLTDMKSLDDYEYSAKKPGFVVTKTNSNLSGSSVYDYPQTARDFTVQSKLSSTINNQINRGFADEGRVNLVNGPNTPVQAKQYIAPNFTHKVATPTMSDAPDATVPLLPYPIKQNPLTANRVSDGFNTIGENDFSNMDQKSDLDSDLDSDFTSVSQRAINPKYNPQNPYTRPSNLFVLQNQFSNPPPPQNVNYQQSPMRSHAQPPSNFQQPVYSPQQRQFGQAPVYQPQPVNYQPHPRPVQYAQRPTISENVLSTNPDFALGGGPRRKANKPKFPAASSFN